MWASEAKKEEETQRTTKRYDLEQIRSNPSSLWGAVQGGFDIGKPLAQEGGHD